MLKVTLGWITDLSPVKVLKETRSLNVILIGYGHFVDLPTAYSKQLLLVDVVLESFTYQFPSTSSLPNPSQPDPDFTAESFYNNWPLEKAAVQSFRNNHFEQSSAFLIKCFPPYCEFQMLQNCKLHVRSTKPLALHVYLG